jgi:hypothetical protein
MPRRVVLCCWAACLSAPALLGATSGTALMPATRDVTIIAREYAFTVPTTVRAGPTTFHFVNRGRVAHEVQLFRFNRNVSAAAARRYLATGQVPDSVADRSGSVLIAAPGDSTREGITVRMVAGERYALLCQFRDAGAKPPHSALGMSGLIEVR